MRLRNYSIPSYISNILDLIEDEAIARVIPTAKNNVKKLLEDLKHKESIELFNLFIFRLFVDINIFLQNSSKEIAELIQLKEYLYAEEEKAAQKNYEFQNTQKHQQYLQELEDMQKLIAIHNNIITILTARKEELTREIIQATDNIKLLESKSELLISKIKQKYIKLQSQYDLLEPRSNVTIGFSNEADPEKEHIVSINIRELIDYLLSEIDSHKLNFSQNKSSDAFINRAMHEYLAENGIINLNKDYLSQVRRNIKDKVFMLINNRDKSLSKVNDSLSSTQRDTNENRATISNYKASLDAINNELDLAHESKERIVAHKHRLITVIENLQRNTSSIASAATDKVAGSYKKIMDGISHAGVNAKAPSQIEPASAQHQYSQDTKNEESLTNASQPLPNTTHKREFSDVVLNSSTFSRPKNSQNHPIKPSSISPENTDTNKDRATPNKDITPTTTIVTNNATPQASPSNNSSENAPATKKRRTFSDSDFDRAVNITKKPPGP